MEHAAYELYHSLIKQADVRLIKWGGSNKALPVVYPWLFVRALGSGLLHRPDVIYLQDGILSPLGWALRLLLRRPSLITIHGLEVTYSSPLYRSAILPYIARQNVVVAVSSETKQKVVRALPKTNPLVILNGLRDDYNRPGSQTSQLKIIAKETGLSLANLQKSHLLHTAGRLVRRKGVLWFVDEVMPRLVREDPAVLYFVSGSGKQHQSIMAAVESRGLTDHVKLLGSVSDDLLKALYNAADVFVMPNVPVLGDMEGFGLVALEAASCGTTVVASNLEGIKDAIIDGKNGWLAEPKDADSFTEIISRELRQKTLQPEAIRDYTLTNYSWEQTATNYEAAMHALTTRSGL